MTSSSPPGRALDAGERPGSEGPSALPDGFGSCDGPDMSMECLLDSEPFATELHELDGATCLWLLSTEHVGRLLLLEPDHAFGSVNFVVLDGAVVVRVESGSDAAACIVGSPVALDVDVFDPYSQTGWSVHVRGVVERLLDRRRADERLRPWMRGPDDSWLRLAALDVSGRWFRAPDRPPVFERGRL
jgi:hypothetical protein